MLNIRHVDDQSYDEIVENAKARLPWLCPTWTDHNSHDPGITVLELMAWYKELQQFYMDQTTDTIRRHMLSLTGVEPLRRRSASCVIEVGSSEPGRARLSRLSNEQGLEFELLEPVPEKRPVLQAMVAEVADTGQRVNIDAVAAGNVSFRPFRFGGMGDTSLRLGFSAKPEKELRLWCAVTSPQGVKRNRPAAESILPRTLVWEAEGCGALTPVSDETWALSWSGYVTLPVPEQWEPGEDGLYWLLLRQEEPGCEEEIRLTGFSAGRYRCVQQRTRAARYDFRIEDAPEQILTVDSAQVMGAQILAYVRRPEGWERLPLPEERAGDASSRRFVLDGRGSAQDGEDNALIVAWDSEYATRLSFTSHGLPEESFFLNLSGQQAMRLTLICPTLEEDGVVRPAFWHQVEDLSACAPRDRVFALDRRRECVCFGNGAHGSIPYPGEIVTAELVLSRCGAGNIPQNAGLFFESDGKPVLNYPARGGRDQETLEETAIRLRLKLADTPKCETAADFERCAGHTPGLRVAFAKALPGYDAYQNGVRRRSASVCVVVLPETENDPAMPDKRFLDAVNRQLERFRPICVRACAIPPRYIPLSISAQLAVTGEADRALIEKALRREFTPRAELVGRTVRRDDLSAVLQKLPGVLQIRRLDLQGEDQNSYQTAAGDLDLQPNGLPRLEKLELTLTSRLVR